MMPEYTANYNLIKPGYDETADIKVINENMDTIDGKLKENEDGLSTHSSKAASTSASGHVQLQTTVDNSETTALTPKALNTHVADDTKHITSTERTIWNNKLDASAYTAADILAKVKTVDGNGSGLDADLLDGAHAGNGPNNVLKLDSGGFVPLPNIPGTLTGKSADMVDGKHFSDIQNDTQAKVDTHANSKQTHGISGGYYLAKTSRSDQLPAWNDIQGKPSIFTPATHGNEAHNPVFALASDLTTHSDDNVKHITDAERNAWNAKETPSGAQSKVDTHASSKQTHGISSGYYIAKTSRSDQLPDWNDIQGKPDLALASDLAAHEEKAAPHSGHETPEGAQEKANIAEANAKNYADNKIDDLAGEGRTTETVKEVADDLVSHKANTANPHNVTKAQVGLTNVDNVKQASKTEFDSHNNDTTRHITSAERTAWNNKAEVSQIPTKVSQLENDRRYVTQEELGDAGYGDMMKAVYDTNNDGIVDVAETVIGNEIQLGSYKLVYNSTTNSLDIEVVA